MFSRNELERRINGLRKIIAGAGLDGVMLMQRADLIYYTGATFQGALAITAEKEAKLFIWRGAGRVGPECPADIIPIRGFGKLVPAMAGAGLGTWKAVGLEEDVFPLSLYRSVALKLWPDAEFKDVSPQIRKQRSVKSEAELAAVRESGRVLSSGFKALRRIIREGMPEYEILAQMEIILRREGDQAETRIRSFNAEAPSVIAFGPSAAVEIVFEGPIGHAGRNPAAAMGPGERIIEPGLPILADVTAGVDGYLTDMTRTFSLGSLAQRFIEAHDLCIGILKETVRNMIPGVVPEDLYQHAVDEAEKAGFGEHFMNRGSSKVRFIGHGVGLELDEFPVLARRFREPLEENMVLAVEPKVVFEDGAVGVEDTVIVKPGGGQFVTEMERGIIDVTC